MAERPIEVVHGAHIADRAKETGDDVKALTQMKVDHVALAERHLGVALARHVEQAGLQIQAGDLVARLQVLDVAARAAGHVEQGLGQSLQLLVDDRLEVFCFGLVVFVAVKLVIVLCSF